MKWKDHSSCWMKVESCLQRKLYSCLMTFILVNGVGDIQLSVLVTQCDGTQWELVFEYNNGHKPVRFDGDNSYPYNFERLEMLFGIDDAQAEDEDDEDE